MLGAFKGSALNADKRLFVLVQGDEYAVNGCGPFLVPEQLRGLSVERIAVELADKLDITYVDSGTTDEEREE